MQSGELPPKGSIKSLFSVLRYLRPYTRQVVAASVALLLSSTCTLLIGVGLRHFVEGINQQDAAYLTRTFFAMLAIVALLAFGTYTRYLLVSWVGERVVADIRRDVFNKLLSMDIGFFETTRTGDILSRLTTDTTLLQTVVGSSVSLFLRNTLIIGGGIIMLAVTDIRLTGYAILIMLLVVVPIITVGRRVRALARATQNKIGDLSAHAEEILGAIRSVQALTLEQSESHRFSDLVDDTMNTALKRIRMRALLTGTAIMLIFGAIVTVIYIGGRDVMLHQSSGAGLLSFVFYAVITASALAAVSEVIGELQRAGGATERLMELMDLQSAIVAPEHPVALSENPQGEIGLENVTFHYPSRPDHAALNNISLTVKPGQTVALVGPSGAGKTTVFQMILRSYDPTSGRITLDDQNIRDVDPQALRSHIGVVPQDPVIFSTNVWHNIRCGNESASDAEVMEAAEIANAKDFILRLPQGFDTYLGEKGVRLSGGQRQRLAIARAVIRNPRILLLDEATSALDSESETAVQLAMARVAQSRTTLIIAHRLSTVLGADAIIVMNEGQIDAIGTHEQLLKSSPLYQRLASLQFKDTNLAA